MTNSNADGTKDLGGGQRGSIHDGYVRNSYEKPGMREKASQAATYAEVTTTACYASETLARMRLRAALASYEGPCATHDSDNRNTTIFRFRKRLGMPNLPTKIIPTRIA